MQHLALLNYIPTDRRLSLAQGRALPTEGIGSVLFADISGFTPLTDALARTLGARLGAEELTRQLNKVYDALTEQVDRYGGSIMGFAGDAITCWFDAGASPAEAARRALTCGLALQTAMQAFAQLPLPNGEYAALSLKVAIASGSARRFIIGDPALQLVDVLVGETLNRMAEAEHQAQKGEVLLDSTTAELVGTACLIREWRSEAEPPAARYAVVQQLLTPAAPAPLLGLDSLNLPPEQVYPWVAASLHQRFDDSITELRPTVALFLRFQGIDYDHDPEAHAKLDAFFRWVQSILQRYDGTLVQLTFGDKGAYLYVTFGAPIAHENSPERAANAAVDLQAMPPEIAATIQPLQIGITQGIMRTGTYGGRTRRTYGALGDDVNMAARLMQQAAPSSTLVSQRIQRSLGKRFVLEELPPLRVKGKEQPIAVARLLARSESSHEISFSRPLVGRSAEVQALFNALAPLLNSQPVGVLYVDGEPGIGKSHLIHTVRQSALQSNSLIWYPCPCDQVIRASLHPVRGPLADYFEQHLADNDHQRKTLFDGRVDSLLAYLHGLDEPRAAALAEELAEARWFVGALLGLRWYGSPYENVDPKLRFERSLRGLDVLLRAESLRRPLVLHVQDAQWLDADTLQFLGYVAESSASYPIALLCDSRPRDDGSRFSLATPAHVPVFHQPVQQLSETGVDELVRLVLDGEVDLSLRKFLLMKASGNPFFTEQMALDLFERGALMRNASGRWSINTLATQEIPVNINAVLIARLDRLLMQVRSVVQIASVLGQEFEVPVLAQMIRDDPEVRLKIKQAEQETIWVGQNDWLYLFRHALLRDAAYNMQLQERLRELHALAGWAIEQVYQEDLTVKSPDLAYHYEKSAIYERAVIYLIRAAQHMASQYSNREAIDYYRRAIALAEKVYLPPEEIVPIYEGLADIYGILGEYGQVISFLDVGLNYLNAEQSAWRTRLYRKKGQALQQWGRYSEATTCYEQGLIELQHDLNPDEASQLYAGLSMINYREGKLEDAIELAMLALMMGQMDDNKRNIAQAYQNLGILHWKQGDYAQARDYDQLSLALWQEVGSANGQAAVYNNLGLLAQSEGDLAQALDHYEASRLRFAQVGNQPGLACVYDNLGQAHMQGGDQARAMEYLEQAVSILAHIGLDGDQVFSSMWQSGAW